MLEDEEIEFEMKGTVKRNDRRKKRSRDDRRKKPKKGNIAIVIEIDERNGIKIIPADEALLVRVRLKFSGSAEEFGI